MLSISNVLLIYPEVPKNTFWSFHFVMPFINKKSAMPPLSLITLAALFPESYNIRLVDLNIEPLTDEHCAWADAVFISSMIIQKDSFQQIVQVFNDLHIPVIAGGPYPTACHDKIQGVDHFVLGEAEDIFVDFLTDLQLGRAGKIYRATEFPSIYNSLTPRFDLLDLDAYATMTVQYSRGCPFSCEFCDIWNLYGHKPRLKSVDSMVQEIDTLYQLGWEGLIFIVDDNFIGNKQKVKTELMPALIDYQKKHKHIFRFMTETSINLAQDPTLLGLMREAGFTEVFIGIESPSTEALQETGKTPNLKIDLLSAVKTIQTNGIEVLGGFILGFDSDTEQIADAQIDFIQRAGISQAMIGLLTALPGTQLYDRMIKEGRLIGEASGNNTHGIATNIVTRMGQAQLKKAYLKLLNSIYDSSMKNYFQRCCILLDNIGAPPSYQREISREEAVIALKSLFKQPFTAYGFQYVKFLLRNVIRHRLMLADVFRFAVMAHHFHSITTQTVKLGKIEHELENGYTFIKDQINNLSLRQEENSPVKINGIVSLWHAKLKILKDIRKKIGSLHVDFREDIILYYDERADRLRKLFSAFEKELFLGGITRKGRF